MKCKFFLSLSFILLSFIITRPATAFDSFLATYGGYDNNPSVTNQETVGKKPVINYEQSPGAAFTTFEAGLSNLFYIEKSKLDVESAVNGFISNYFGLGNKSAIQGSINASKLFFNGLIIPDINSGASIYRDDITNINSTDEFYAGAGITINISAEHSIYLGTKYHWLFYKDDIQFVTGPQQEGGQQHSLKGKKGPEGKQTTKLHNVKREEKLWETIIEYTSFVTPSLTLTAGFSYTGLYSSVMGFSYDQIQISAGPTYSPIPTWNIDLGVSWFKNHYTDQIQNSLAPTSRTWSLGFEVSKTWKKLIFSFSIDWQQNEDIYEETSKDRIISNAGFEWVF